MAPTEFTPFRPRVCAVSYLNTVPLVWGLLHDPPLQEVFDLGFAVPSECAAQLASGQADIGILPVVEMARQRLDFFRGSGIASFGPVRSILLISKVPFGEIRTLATDSGSRTSVMLARIILAEKFGAAPSLTSLPPDLTAMLGVADAALLIGRHGVASGAGRASIESRLSRPDCHASLMASSPPGSKFTVR